MKPVREQDAFAQHALVSRRKFDFGDGKRVSQMQASVHIRVGEGSEPFRVLVLDFGWRETSDVSW